MKSNPVVWQGNNPGQSGMTDTLRRPTATSTGEAVISPDAVLRFMVTRPDGPKFVPKHELSR